MTAIHVTHRIGAALLSVAAAAFAWRLYQTGAAQSAPRRYAGAIVAVLGWQIASGLGNVVLGWPLLAAVAHTGGAAALVIVLTRLITRAAQARSAGTLRQEPRGRVGFAARAPS